MTEQTDTERRLQRIESKLDRLINGGSGQPGIFDRMSQFESKQGFLSYCYGWIVAGLMTLGWMVIPAYFRNNK